MNVSLKSAIVAATLVGAGVIGMHSASALPAVGLDPAVATGSDLSPMVQDVRWVCGPYRCRWAPNVWYRPAPYWRPGPRWGWRRRWW